MTTATTTRSHALAPSHPGLWPRVEPAAPAARTLLRRVAASLWSALAAVGASRSRRVLLTLAREQDAIRPELAATLRAAARDGWL